jgi:BirA family biotin operon repressor/biotin-[acetyl-CoA-carboxylase] ligase
MRGPAILPEGVARRAFASLGSTNSEAMAMARAGERGPVWITADEQTAGRGRRGRIWISEPGNLHASLLVSDPAAPAMAATLSFVAGIALFEALAEIVSPPARSGMALKWPNDLILARRKIAGILVEGETMPDGRLAVVLGFGVNCRSNPDIPDVVYSPGNLQAQGEAADSEFLFRKLASTLAREMKLWARGTGFAAKTRRRWLDRALGFSQEISVQLQDRVVDGRFEDVDAEGRLIVRRPNGDREAIAAGDVFFARDLR